MRQDTDAMPFLELGELGLAAMEVWLDGWSLPTVRRARVHERLQHLVQGARRHVPLYQRLYRRLPEQQALELAQLPVLTKRLLMTDVAASLADRSITRADLDAFVTEPARVGELFRNRYAVWTSSGTSGTMGLFVHDRRALAIYEALEALRFRGLSSFTDYGTRILTGERFALVMVTGGHFASVSSAEHLRRAFPWLAPGIKPFSLLAPLDEVMAGLNAYRPTHLATYPTAAEMFAHEQEAGRLQLQLTELWTGGEFLAECVKARLQRVFKCRVRNGYGASEFLSIAFECAHGTLHVNDDWVLLEPVDEAYRPALPGTPSHSTLLTNLANRAQPLIRYDIGDSITELPRCPCGSSFPAIRVEGRRDDALHVTDREGRLRSLLPLVLTTVIEEEGGVYDFQLTQTGARTLRLALGPQGAAKAEHVRAALERHLAQHAIDSIAIEIDALAPRRNSSGKLRRVVYAAHERSAAIEPAL
jgi:phenylacetate-coenzyme A ligase PaaK-like adenylate-forming protein